jgi:hypothetical protein
MSHDQEIGEGFVYEKDVLGLDKRHVVTGLSERTDH